MIMFDTIIRFILSKSLSDETHFYINDEVMVYINDKIKNIVRRFLGETFPVLFVEFVFGFVCLVKLCIC